MNAAQIQGLRNVAASMMTRIVRVELETDLSGNITVWPIWSNVDRPHGTGMSCAKDKRLVARYSAAVMAGKVFPSARVAVDVNGKSYVDAACQVRGRALNADLAKLGF